MTEWRTGLWWGAGIALLAGAAVWRERQNPCGPFPDWQTSAYVLPYRVGATYFVSQSSCTNGGHQGAYRFSYDFSMPIGTIVTAARAGVVADLRTKFRDGQHGLDESNWVKIRHTDGSIAAYVHLTQGGALVKIGDRVAAGQPIGVSGNTGNTGGWPHLHFHLSSCVEPARCGTLPVTFRNTEPNLRGLDGKRFYPALSYRKDDV